MHFPLVFVIVLLSGWAYLAKLEQRNENELLVSSHHDGTNGNSGCGEALHGKERVNSLYGSLFSPVDIGKTYHSEAEEALQVVMEASVHHPTIVEEE